MSTGARDTGVSVRGFPHNARNTKVQFEALTLTCQQEEQRRRLQHDGTLRGKLSQRETQSSPQHSHHPQSPVQQTRCDRHDAV